jgi:hypothetical protein
MIEDLGMNLVKGKRGEVRGVVRRILASAENLFLWREHAHHGKQVAVDLDLLTDRGIVAE